MSGFLIAGIRYFILFNIIYEPLSHVSHLASVLTLQYINKIIDINVFFLLFFFSNANSIAI